MSDISLPLISSNLDRFADIADSLPIVLIECDKEGKLLFLNRKAQATLNLLNTEYPSRLIFDFLDDEDTAKAKSFFTQPVTEKRYFSDEFTFTRKDASRFSGYAVIERFDNILRWTIIDISEISAIHKKIVDAENRHKILVEHAVYQALHDSLTDVFNKEMFNMRLQVEILRGTKRHSRGAKIAVVCLGIDRFKRINDLHGTKAGDQILQQTAKRLLNSVRPDDTVARFDGDKFMILFTDVASNDDLPIILQKIFSAFSDPFIVDEESHKISISIGVCLFPDDAVEESSLIKNAEEAMFTAKDRGGNLYEFFDHTMHNEMINRAILENDIYQAVKTEEFVTFYQPKLSRDGKLLGMEALIRWYCKRRGTFISPLDFIPLAEKNGKIVDIGYIVLRQSCIQNKLWIDEGLTPLKVSVNLSPYQFRQGRLVENIKSIVKDSGLDPRHLELEITESGILENEKENINKMTELHDIGISITIDDFGTGFSSLSKLKDYPINTLKIDKKFIDPLPHDHKSQTIVRAIIELAHNLEFQVVCEGIENAAQLDFLISHNCDQFQGYYFSKPLDAADFRAAMEKGFIHPA